MPGPPGKRRQRHAGGVQVGDMKQRKAAQPHALVAYSKLGAADLQGRIGHAGLVAIQQVILQRAQRQPGGLSRLAAVKLLQAQQRRGRGLMQGQLGATLSPPGGRLSLACKSSRSRSARPGSSPVCFRKAA